MVIPALPFLCDIYLTIEHESTTPHYKSWAMPEYYISQFSMKTKPCGPECGVGRGGEEKNLPLPDSVIPI